MGLGKLIITNCAKHGLNPQLVAALIHQESKGNPWATRYEPDFFKRYIQNKDWARLGGYVSKAVSLETERKDRSTSFGVMQIMGQTARERGFRGDYLTQLLDPAINIEIGCDFLADLIQKHEKAEIALLRWNGGGDPKYPAKVFAHIDSGDCAQHLVG